MKDGLGNTIHGGDLVSWNISAELLRRMVFQVIKADDGGISTADGGKTPGLLIIAVTIPIPKPHQELMDFRCLRNPESEALISQLPLPPSQRKM
jgi:hypothetical protein